MTRQGPGRSLARPQRQLSNVDFGRVRGQPRCWPLGQQVQLVPQAPAMASSMIRRMVRAHRPHWALQPRQP